MRAAAAEAPAPLKEFTQRPPGDLLANPKNPRRHPEDQLDRLGASLKKFGQPKPILVRRANLMVVAGHGIHEAATRAKLPLLDLILWNVDQKTADDYMLADNRLGDLSHDDDDAVAALLRDIDEAERLAVGFSDSEAEKLLRELEEDSLQVMTVETGDVADQFWIAVRGPLKDQAGVLDRLKKLLAEFPDVDVTLGTVSA